MVKMRLGSYLMVSVLVAGFSHPALSQSFSDLWKQHGGSLIDNSPTIEAPTPKISESKSVTQLEFRNVVVTYADKQAAVSGQIMTAKPASDLKLDGHDIFFSSDGFFEFTVHVPVYGRDITLVLTDITGQTAVEQIKLSRNNIQKITNEPQFDTLNPIGRQTEDKPNGLALIVGIANYENTLSAPFADKDALIFQDYASEIFGIPENRIKTLINDEADIAEILISVRKWLKRMTVIGQTEVIIFFAGHGLATASGDAYLLPFDGHAELELLDRTALLQQEIFDEVALAQPKSVTVFLDACYTGKSRDGEVLLADAGYRPVAARVVEGGLPPNFTVLTASSGLEFSGPLKEAKHGMFSYFLMRGLEGLADLNNDQQITAGVLIEYVRSNVTRYSAGLQTPEIQGDKSRILVSFK